MSPTNIKNLLKQTFFKLDTYIAGVNISLLIFFVNSFIFNTSLFYKNFLSIFIGFNIINLIAVLFIYELFKK